MSRSATITTQDARALMRIMRTTLELPKNPVLRWSHLVTGMCQLMGGRSGLFGIIDADPESGTARIIHGIEGGDVDSRSHSLYKDYVSNQHARDPLMLHLDPALRRAQTASRRERVDDRTWYGSPFVNEFRFKLGIDDGIYAMTPLGNGRFVGVGINREKGGRPFTPRERILMELLADHLDWLYGQTESAEMAPDLTPRAREVLQHLINGASEKQIAAALSISKHTVHDHVKRLYDLYNVSTRAELLARHGNRR